MQKVLRTLCMGIVAAFSAASLAQTNVTDKLLNPDAEKGMLGWDVTFVDGGQVWNKQTKGQEKAVGYHGYFNWAFENWRNNAAGLTDGSIFQVVEDLPDGTYVFGAYATATRDAWTPSIDDITGVSIFANEYSLPVATHRVEGMDEKWAHAIKFNVAATVTGGTLKVGMKTEATTASFVTMDNATLYYFGEMSHKEALAAMAKIDIAASIDSVSVFLTAGKMNADTLASLQSAIEAAQEVTVENAAQLDEDLYWGKRQAKKSIAAYAELAAAIESGKEIAAKEWSDVEETIVALEALKELIVACEEKYNDGTALNLEATTWAAELAEAGALVELDSCYIRAEEYYAAIDTLTIGDEVGQYTFADYEKAQAYYDEVMIILADASAGEESALTAMSMCEALFSQIQQIFDNPIDYSQFPITINRSTTTKIGDFYLLDGAVSHVNGSGQTYATYTSKTYRFREPLTKIRFTVKETGINGLCGNYPFFHLGELELFDEEGNKIELTVDNLYSNACFNTLTGRADGIGLLGLIDGDYTTHFHSVYDNNFAVNEHHYIEITLPEDREYYGFSFVMSGRQNGQTYYNTRQCPAVLDIRYVSDAINGLKDAIKEVDNKNPQLGNSPGYYTTGVQNYYDAVAHAKELAEADFVSDSDIKEAINALYSATENLNDNFVLPEAGKKYRILSSEPSFVKNQNVHKAWTIHEEDTVYSNWLWWEDAGIDSVKQEFSFEFIENESNKLYYNIKHEATGLYLADWRDEDGVRCTDMARFTLSEKADTFEVRHIGAGEWIFVREGYSSTILHMLNHNSGVAQPDVAAQSGVGKGKGIRSSIIIWNNATYDYSGFYIREMMELPCATKSISDLMFVSQNYTVYNGVNILTLTADKESAFEGLAFTSGMGLNIAPESVSVKGNVATVTFTDAIGEFQFSFNNAEGVEEVVVDGSFIVKSVSLEALRATYDQVLAIAPVEGNDVGQVSDLSEYNAALEAAEVILDNGAAEEEILAAKAALEAAKANIVYNLPKEGVEYLILLGLDAIRGNHLTDMAVFADVEKSTLRWTYVSLTNAAYRWRFIDCGQLKNDLPAYYLENVSTGRYATRTTESNSMILVEDSVNARPFNIFFVGKDKVAIGDSYWADGGQSIHPMNHGSGASGNKGSYMITWGKHDAASAMRVVEAEPYIEDVIFSINDIEEIEAADEQVAPAVKGIYDLFGRRIEVPATTGIYIVDGKKQVIKK